MLTPRTGERHPEKNSNASSTNMTNHFLGSLVGGGFLYISTSADTHQQDIRLIICINTIRWAGVYNCFRPPFWGGVPHKSQFCANLGSKRGKQKTSISTPRSYRRHASKKNSNTFSTNITSDFLSNHALHGRGSWNWGWTGIRIV